MWRVKHFLEVTAVEQIILAYQHLQIINRHLYWKRLHPRQSADVSLS